MKNAFFGRVWKTVFSRWQKKLFFSLTKSRCLSEKKGVQFAWAKSNNMPLSGHDTQELWQLLYLKAEGIERQERLQYLRQTWKILHLV